MENDKKQSIENYLAEITDKNWDKLRAGLSNILGLQAIQLLKKMGYHDMKVEEDGTISGNYQSGPWESTYVLKNIDISLMQEGLKVHGDIIEVRPNDRNVI